MVDLRLFAKRLKKARSEKELTQKQLADAVGVAATTISYYEKNSETSDRKTPALDKVYAISEVLGVSVDWLCGKGDSATPITGNGYCYTAANELRFISCLLADFELETRADSGIMLLGANKDGRYIIAVSKIYAAIQAMKQAGMSGKYTEAVVNSIIDRYEKGLDL